MLCLIVRWFYDRLTFPPFAESASSMKLKHLDKCYDASCVCINPLDNILDRTLCRRNTTFSSRFVCPKSLIPAFRTFTLYTAGFGLCAVFKRKLHRKEHPHCEILTYNVSGCLHRAHVLSLTLYTLCRPPRQPSVQPRHFR